MDIVEHIEQEHAGSKAQHIKSIVYGGLDGIITTFSIVAASVGAGLEMHFIISLAGANLIADGLSMGIGDYVSSMFENSYINSELSKEKYEYEHNKDGEVAELIQLYKAEGLDQTDAEDLVNIISKEPYIDVFLTHMLDLELGLRLPDNHPAKDGLVTFISFISSGFLPCLSYAIFYSTNTEYYISFGVTTVICILAMFLLGVVQAHITKQSRVKGGLIMMGVGTLASASAFGIGYGLERLLA